MEYDILVIGGGPGGYVAAIRAAHLGAKVCLVEKRQQLGGVCLNEGCIPTKVFVRTACLLQQLRECSSLGITGVDTTSLNIGFEALQSRKKTIIQQLVGGVFSLMKANGVTVVQGSASFLDAHTIEVAGQTIAASNVIVATGSETFIPDFIRQIDSPEILTSREVLDLQEPPESIAIIGGGVIGIEFAYILSAMGTKVSVFEMCESILPMVDAEIATLAQKSLAKQGVEFHLGTKVQSISRQTICFSKMGEETTLPIQKSLMAIGRMPFTQGLNAEGIGITFRGRAIANNEFLRTNLPHIYAIGDVNGQSMLAHTASHEGLIAVENILGGQKKMRYDRIPACIYMNPEIACIGLTEAQAREKYDAVSVGRFPLAANGKALIEGEAGGMVKVVAEREFGELLGVHMMAPHATDMIATAGLAMNLEGTLDEMVETIYPHPTVSEALAEAFMAAKDKAIHWC